MTEYKSKLHQIAESFWMNLGTTVWVNNMATVQKKKLQECQGYKRQVTVDLKYLPKLLGEEATSSI